MIILTGLHDLLCQLHVGQLKALTFVPGFIQDTDQVDDHLLSGEILTEIITVVNIALHDLHGGQDQEMAMAFPVAGENSYAMTILYQPTDQMCPYKTSSSQYTDVQLLHNNCIALVILSWPNAVMESYTHTHCHIKSYVCILHTLFNNMTTRCNKD